MVDGVPTFLRIAEAIAAARHSVWLTVAFFAPDFRFPDGRGLFDVLDAAVGRGLDVRALFWRPNPESSRYGRTFPGTAADREMLIARDSQFRIRWDRASAAFCQHQKSWLIDAGQPTETAFVGGINLTAKAVGSPGHRDGGRHDAYVEITGPSATDVHHNFVQRWNEASERDLPNGLWGPGDAGPLTFPNRTSSPRGESLVQIQRMVAPGRYADGQAAPGANPFPVIEGERSILEQYEAAIDAARSTIYIETQALPVPTIARRLEAALVRGVQVILLVPAEPEDGVRAARRDPARSALFEATEALDRQSGFMLASLMAPQAAEPRPVYVHSKIMLVDDAWATIGSCNLHANSLGGHSELNASVWDAGVVRNLRCRLFAEHLGHDTSGLDDRAAALAFREVAERNRRCLELHEGSQTGLAFSLEAVTYGR
jgi:cardiolipin synthase